MKKITIILVVLFIAVLTSYLYHQTRADEIKAGNIKKLLAENQFDQAYQKLITHDFNKKNFQSSILKLINYYLESLNEQKAVYLLKESIDNEIFSYDILSELKNLSYEKKLYNFSKIILENLLDKNPDQKSIKHELARVNAWLGNNIESEKFYKLALEPLKIELPQDLLSEPVPDWVARWELARVLSYQKKYHEAISNYQKLIKSNPDITELKLELANIYFITDNKKETANILDSLPVDNLDSSTMVMLGDIYVSQKNYKKARIVYEKYIKINPEDLNIRFKLADLLSWIKEYESSIHHYRYILDNQPDNIQIRRKYAFVLLWAGKHEQAEIELKKTLKD